MKRTSLFNYMKELIEEKRKTDADFVFFYNKVEKYLNKAEKHGKVYKLEKNDVTHLNLNLNKFNQVKGGKSSYFKFLTVKSINNNKIKFNKVLLFVQVSYDNTSYYYISKHKFGVNNPFINWFEVCYNKADFLRNNGFKEEQAVKVAFLTVEEREALKELKKGGITRFGAFDTVESPTEDEIDLFREYNQEEEFYRDMVEKAPYLLKTDREREQEDYFKYITVCKAIGEDTEAEEHRRQYFKQNQIRKQGVKNYIKRQQKN